MADALERDSITHDPAVKTRDSPDITGTGLIAERHFEPDEELEVYENPTDTQPAGKQHASRAYATGLLHRAVYVWVFNSAGQVVMRRRALDVPICPDTWDVSATAHVRPGESSQDTAWRALHECLGLSKELLDAAACALEGPLLPPHVMSVNLPGNFHQNQLVDSFRLSGCNLPPALNHKVSAEAVFMAPSALQALVDTSVAATFAPWLLKELEAVHWFRGGAVDTHPAGPAEAAGQKPAPAGHMQA